jgi:hypothetical protein
MKKFIIAALFCALMCTSNLLAQETIQVTQKKDSLFFSVQNKLILKAVVSGNVSKLQMHEHHYTLNNAVYQTISLVPADFKRFSFKAIVMADEGSIACESDRWNEGLSIVRHTVGKSFNLLNNAVYNRNEDWLLSFDAAYPALNLQPQENNNYQIQVVKSELIIRFKPRYYQQHRGLTYFKPKEYQIWQKPVVGWCSWFAYFDNVTENDMHRTADVLSTKLKKYGLDYIQIDDGYQQVPIGMPDTWTHANKKFPAGMGNLAQYISSKGFQPGIWTNVAFADSAAAYQHKDLFIKTGNNQIALGNWVGYVMNGANKATLDQLIKPIYAEFNKEGWQYFKLDALRHLKYEGYNTFSKDLIREGINKNEAYRNVVTAVRKQIGKNKFLMACWGIRPELVGLVDGCRIGNDGYSYAGLAQFNSYNNIIWRNDPDHIVLSAKEAYRSCIATSLTGSLFMLTDQPELYEKSNLIDAAIRSIPVLITSPGQVYDVDPSRSSLIAQVETEMSGSGPRPFDASTTTTTGLFQMDINKPYENWTVLGRLDERDRVIPLKDLGLDSKKEYLVFEFWRKEFKGIQTKQFTPGAIDTAFNCQLFCFREKQNHPQLLATNRHISCGALELTQLHWSDNRLTGTSNLIADDLYSIYVYESAGAQFKAVDTGKATLIENVLSGNIRKISFRSSDAAAVQWEISYQ